MGKKNEPQVDEKTKQRISDVITVHEFFEVLGIPFDIIYPNIPIPKNSRELSSNSKILKDEDYEKSDME
jgi:hypothetical protein